MSIFSSLIESSWRSLIDFKNMLVGDLTFQDIIYFTLKQKSPERFRQALACSKQKNVALPNNSNIFIANYGLLGTLLDLNTAVIKPQNKAALMTLLKKTDTSHGRDGYDSTKHITDGISTVVNITGAAGLERHKALANILPSPNFVIETAIKFTNEAWEAEKLRRKKTYEDAIKQAPIEAKRTAHAYNCDETREATYAANLIARAKDTFESETDFIFFENLVHKIMMYVLIGFDIKTEHHDLIIRMAKADPDAAKDYKLLMKEAIEHQKTHPLNECALWKALNKPNIASDAPLIHDLFTTLTTAENVLAVVSNGTQDKALLNAFITEINATSQDDDKRRTLRYHTLETMFQSAVRSSQFKLKKLPRYIQHSFTWENQIIPDKTTCFIDHYIEDTSTQSSAFSLGPRQCPGQQLTKHIFKGIIATLVKKQYIHSEQMFVDNASSTASMHTHRN